MAFDFARFSAATGGGSWGMGNGAGILAGQPAPGPLSGVGGAWQQLLDPSVALPAAAALIGGRTLKDSFAGALQAAAPGLVAAKKRAAVNAWLKARSGKGNLSPEMVQFIQASPDLAERLAINDLGGGKAAAAPVTREFYDPTTGTNHIKQWDGGEWKDIGFGKPAAGTSLEFDPETGAFHMTQGVGVNQQGNQPLTKTETSALQKDIPALEQQKQQIEHIGDLYDPNFLTYTGKARTGINRVLDKAGLNGPEGKAQLAGATKFKQNVEQVFNAYRKDITGAAAAVAELDRLKQSVINTDQSPTEFEAAMGEFARQLQRGLDIKKQLLDEGIPLGSTKFGKRFDELFLGGGEAPAEAPAAPAGAANPVAGAPAMVARPGATGAAMPYTEYFK